MFDITGLIVIICVVILLCIIFYLIYRNNQILNYKDVGTVPLHVVHQFFSESIFALLDRVQYQIEDHFESEYSDEQMLLEEQLNRYTDLIIAYSAYCGICGAKLPLIAQSPDYEFPQEPWLISLSCFARTEITFKIKPNNVSYLIDRLTDMNDYNEKLISVIKRNAQ